MQLLESELIERPQYYKKNTYACKAEPRSLVESWDDGKFQECASVIPYAVVVAGGDSEAIISWREIRIKSLSPFTRFLPPRIPAFQVLTEMDFFRHSYTPTAVSHLHVPSL